MIISFFIFVLIASLLVALAEIQIEGKSGWAKNLPTWRKIRIPRLLFYCFTVSCVNIYFHCQPLTVTAHI